MAIRTILVVNCPDPANSSIDNSGFERDVLSDHDGHAEDQWQALKTVAGEASVQRAEELTMS